MLTLPIASIDRLEAHGLGVEVVLHLRDVDGMDVPAFLGEADPGHPLARLEPLAVLHRRRGGEPPARAPHDLVDDEHARARPVLADDVLREDARLLGGAPRPERLLDRHDVVVDRLGQAHDGEVVAVHLQVRREVGGGRVRVVAADRVKDVDLVLLELLGGDGEGVLPLLDEAALDAVAWRSSA